MPLSMRPQVTAYRIFNLTYRRWALILPGTYNFTKAAEACRMAALHQISSLGGPGIFSRHVPEKGGPGTGIGQTTTHNSACSGEREVAASTVNLLKRECPASR